jgi:hypothetical protein
MPLELKAVPYGMFGIEGDGGRGEKKMIRIY